MNDKIKVNLNKGNFYIYKALPLDVVNESTIDFKVDLGFGEEKAIRTKVSGSIPSSEGEERDIAMKKIHTALTTYEGVWKDCLIRTYKDVKDDRGHYLVDVFYVSNEQGVPQEFCFEDRAYLDLAKFLLDEGVAEED